MQGEHIREGLSAIVSVKVPNPEFEGQTKTRLGNPEVRKIVETSTSDVSYIFSIYTGHQIITAECAHLLEVLL